MLISSLRQILWLTLASLSTTSWAYDVLIINQSDGPVNPYIQSLGDGEAPDAAGFLNSSKDRIYDNRNPFLNHPSMGVKEGDVRSISIYDPSAIKFRPCGDIKFEGGKVITYDGTTCIATTMPLVDKTQAYQKRGSDTDSSFGWVIEHFDIDDVTARIYADGPEDLVWSLPSGNAVITFKAVEHSTHNLQDIKVNGYKTDPCGHWPMNDGAACDAPIDTNLHVVYDTALNPNLPAGKYSGIAKIFGRLWHGGDESTAYVNLEIAV